MTETYRAGAEGQQKTSALLHAFASLLEDLLLLQAGTGHLMRNIDLKAELTRISQTVDVAWIEGAVRGMDQVEQGMRRNLLRSLALDSFAVGLSPCLIHAIFRLSLTVKPEGPHPASYPLDFHNQDDARLLCNSGAPHL